MILALDTNALIALLVKDHPFQARIVETLKDYEGKRHFVISPFVYAEAHSIPNFERSVFHIFLGDVGISVDTALPDSLWERAGAAHAQYHARCKHSGYTEQKRLLTDFPYRRSRAWRERPLGHL